MWGTEFMRGELCHAAANGALPAFARTLCALLGACGPAARRVVAGFVAGPSAYAASLFVSSAAVRAASARLLSEVAIAVIEREAAAGGDGSAPAAAGEGALSQRWLEGMRAVAADASRHWTRHKYFWGVFSEVARRSGAARRLLARGGAVSLMLGYFLEHRSPPAAATPHAHSMGNSSFQPQMDPLLDAVTVLVAAAHTRGSAAGHAALRAVVVPRFDADCPDTVALPVGSAAGVAVAVAASAPEEELLSLTPTDMECLQVRAWRYAFAYAVARMC